jgi:hypothetical protein
MAYSKNMAIAKLVEFQIALILNEEFCPKMGLSEKKLVFRA